MSQTLSEKSDGMMMSVIIVNFNYADFLAAAIDSALALAWPAVEVIVVDDGSTDHSKDIIASYGSKVIPIYQDNRGRVRATNRGYAASTGQMIIFLDSDDMLHPELLSGVAKAWRPEVSKIQCQMLRVDGSGQSLGTIIPQFRSKPEPAQIMRWVSTTSAYPTPPGSGNIYARWFLDEIFPVDPTLWDATDSPCLAAAPYFGDIETISKPLVYYRIHSRNDSQMVGFDAGIAVRDVRRTQQRFAYAKALAGSKGIVVESGAVFRSMSFASNRMVSYRFARDRHPVEADSRVRIIYDALRAAFSPQGMTPQASLISVLWIMLISITPSRIAKQMVCWRFIPASRPRKVVALLRRSGALRTV